MTGVQTCALPISGKNGETIKSGQQKTTRYRWNMGNLGSQWPPVYVDRLISLYSVCILPADPGVSGRIHVASATQGQQLDGLSAGGDDFPQVS